MRRLYLLLVLMCVPLFFAPRVVAQNTASIVGLVTDSSGAAMPNVTITISNPAQAFSQTVVSDSAGAYKVGFLKIGTYNVAAEAAGFQKYLQSDIKLEIGQTQRVDIAMQVGSVTQEITVTGNVVKGADRRVSAFLRGSGKPNRGDQYQWTELRRPVYAASRRRRNQQLRHHPDRAECYFLCQLQRDKLCPVRLAGRRRQPLQLERQR